MIRTAGWALGAMLAIAGPAGAQRQAAHRNGAEGLEAFFAASTEACTTKQFAAGKAMTLSVLPNRDDVRKALRDDVAPAFVDKLLTLYGQLPPTDAQAACLFTPGEGRTVIKAYAATTEQIRAGAPGTAAADEFPGGAHTLAEQFLRPGVTFYEVEITKPGESAGMKYHLFFWDGVGWRMLGPAWRALR